MAVQNPPTPNAKPAVEAPDAGVIEDARARQRRQRRRGAIGFLVLALLGCIAAIAALAISGSSPPPTATSAGTAGVLPNGSLATLHMAGPLAVAPDGALYVTDVVGAGVEPGGDRVLVRLPDGRFRVIAGNGKVGFSGDGGPAVRAELSGVSDSCSRPTARSTSPTADACEPSAATA